MCVVSARQKYDALRGNVSRGDGAVECLEGRLEACPGYHLRRRERRPRCCGLLSLAWHQVCMFARWEGRGRVAVELPLCFSLHLLPLSFMSINMFSTSDLQPLLCVGTQLLP